MNRTIRLLFFIPALLAGAALVGCDDGPSSASLLIEEALGHRNKGDLKASIAALKTALKDEPDNADARALLGEIYMHADDHPSATKELLRARALGRDTEQIRLLLVTSWLAQGEFESVLKEIPEGFRAGTPVETELLIARGRALMLAKRPGDATTVLEATLKQEPHPRAYTELARIALTQSEVDEAIDRLGKGLESFPQDVQLLTQLGEVLMLKGRDGEAETNFAKALEQPDRLGSETYAAQMGLTRARLAQGKHAEAEEVLGELKKHSAEDSGVKLLDGLLSFVNKDYETAARLADEIIKDDPENATALFVKGGSSFYLGHLEEANHRLSTYVARIPGNMAARKLLALTQMAIGEADKAYSLLASHAGSGTPDGPYLELLSDAARLAGHREASLQAMQQAVHQFPNDAAMRAKLGLIRIAADGQAGSGDGLSDLEAATTIDPNMAQAKAQLAVEYIKRGEHDKALSIARELQAEHPESAFGYNLEGMALVGQERFDEAVPQLEKGLEIEPGDLGTAVNLSQVMRRKEDLTGAARVLEATLEHLPGNLTLLVQLAELEQERGRHDESIDYLKQALEANPEVHLPHVLLARRYLEDGEPLQAISVAEPVVDKFPMAFSLRETVGRAQLQLGRFWEAAQTFRKLIEKRPDDSTPHVLLAQSMLARGDQPGAEKSLEKALTLNADDHGARLLLAQILIGSNKEQRGREEVAKLMAALPDNPDVLELESAVLMADGKAAESVDAARKAFTTTPSTTRVIRLAQMQSMAGEAGAARETLESWLREHPEDQVVRLQLGESWMAEGEFTEARRHLQRLVRMAPDSVRARNSLAWVLLRLGDVENATLQAEAAHALTPNDPNVLDTLGTILVSGGEHARGIELLEKAVDGQPNQPAFKIHLAQALIRTGETERSRKILEALMATDQDFPGRDTVRSLLDGLAN